MKKTVQIVLVLLLLTCTYRYAHVVGTVSYVQEAAEENCASEMDEEAENEIISKMKVTVGEALKIAELAGQEEPKETEESEVQRYYREAIESAQLDWEWVIQPGYADDFIFLGGTYIAVRQNNGKYGVIDENGVSVFSEEYDSISPYSENMAKACNDGKHFYIDRMGEKVIEGIFQDAKSFFEKRAAVQMEGRWGFIDSDGRMTVSCQYDEVKDYSEGFAAVKKDGKWGYIDETGQVVIDLMYDDVGSFSEGKTAVKLEDYTENGLDAWSYINSENTVVLGPYIDWHIPAFSMHASEFHDGLAYVVDEVPTIINEKGEEVFDSPFFITGYADSKYKAIPGYLFTDDLMKERTYGLVGLDGKCLLEPVFYDVDGPYEDYVRVEVVIDEIPCKGVIRLKEKQENSVIDQLWQECSLPQEEWPDYYYFTNEGHYRLGLVNATAFVVKEYAADSGMHNEEWNLKRIYSCGDTDAFLAYVESKTEDELYILISEGPGAQPVYIILADIRKDANPDVSLPYGGYAYNSMLEWDSYKDWFDGEADGQHIHYEMIGDIHDSIYDAGLACAIDDYVDRTGGDTESQWEMYGNDIYVGKNGYIACAVCQNKSRNFIVLFDVSNKVYAVVEL